MLYLPTTEDAEDAEGQSCSFDVPGSRPERSEERAMNQQDFASVSSTSSVVRNVLRLQPDRASSTRCVSYPALTSSSYACQTSSGISWAI
jgi:hypothetical protein